VLQAAIDLIIREGVDSLTLDRVAREAGVSKGGLLYHYAGKEQLIAGLVELLLIRLRHYQVLTQDRSVLAPGVHTRSFVEAALQQPARQENDSPGDLRPLQGHEIAAILMAAMTSAPSLLDPLREMYRDWQDSLDHDGIDPARAVVARLAAEGLWFSEALGLAPPPPDRRASIVREIHSLIEPGGGMSAPPNIIQPVPTADVVAILASAQEDFQELSQQAHHSAQAAAHTLLRWQNRAGFWRGDLTADTTLESDFVFLALWLYPPAAGESDWNPPCRDQINMALATLLDRQLADGGWNIYPGGPAEISATARAYVALKIGGYDPQWPQMRRARERVLALGGLQAANSYTRINLSLFGMFPRQFAPSIPPELVLMPGNLLYEMSSWSRVIIMPLSIIQALGAQRPTPGGTNVDELYLPHKKLALPKRDRISAVFNQADRVLKLWERRGLKEIRAKAIREAEKWTLDHMRYSDGVGAIYPSMMYALMAMDALGYERDHPDFVETLRQFEGLILVKGESPAYGQSAAIVPADTGLAATISSGSRMEFQPSLSPVWDTAISMFALGELGDELGAAESAAMRAAADWLLDREVRRKGDWSVKRPSLPPSGWAFEFANEFYPDIDDTAMVLLALQHATASDPERQVRAERRAIQWLLGMQSSDGGWAAFDVDNNWQVLSKVPFADHNAMLDPTCPDITGRVIEALCRRGYTQEHPAIARGVRYLLSHQRPDGSWYGRWGVNYTYGTFLAMRGLQASGVASSAAVAAMRLGAKWLRSVQNPDGGWGESCASYEMHHFVTAGSTPSQTAWALLGLDAGGESASDAARRGVAWLVEHQNTAGSAAGSWDEELMTGTGFPNVFYLSYHLYRHYFPLLALAAWRKSMGGHTTSRLVPRTV
jgi:squalene-hopene/tetraprenyl-beta-curcumene cyclase